MMLRCKIRDATFAHDKSATAWKTPKYMEWVRDDAPTNGPNFYVDGHLADLDVGDERGVNIGWLHEPPELIPNIYADARYYSQKFATTLTYHPELCGYPGFTFALYGGVWIEEKDWGQHNKHRLCSMLYGAKRATSGHLIRHAIAENLQRYSLGYPVDFYGPYGVPTDYSIATKLRVHKTYAFFDCV